MYCRHGPHPFYVFFCLYSVHYPTQSQGSGESNLSHHALLVWAHSTLLLWALYAWSQLGTLDKQTDIHFKIRPLHWNCIGYYFLFYCTNAKWISFLNCLWSSPSWPLLSQHQIINVISDIQSTVSCFMGNLLPEEWIFEVQCIARLKSWLVNDCHNVNIITLPIQNTGLICFYFFEKFCGKHISTCCCGDNKYLLLAMSWTLPDNVCPILAKSGVWRRHRTWYQWVSGWLGAVESHMVILWKTFGRTFRIQNKSKMWFTISTAIGYLKCLSGKWKRWEITGIPKAQDILGKKQDFTCTISMDKDDQPLTIQ